MSMTSNRTAVPRKVSLVKRSDQQGQRGPAAARMGAAFQQDTARSLQILQYMQFAIVGGLVLLIVLLANFSTTNSRLFATTAEGKLIIPPPVDQEAGDNIVNLWLVDSMTKIMTMGFHDYQTRLLDIRPLFNDRGWESFSRFHRTPYAGHAALRNELETQYLMLKARLRSPPMIIDKSLIGGVFTYRVQIKLGVTRYINGTDLEAWETFELIIERVKPEVNPSGIAIASWRYTGTN